MWPTQKVGKNKKHLRMCPSESPLSLGVRSPEMRHLITEYGIIV